MGERHLTFHTRIPSSIEADIILSAYADVYGRAERKLFAKLANGGDSSKLKSTFLKEFGITARQFNAISIGLKGKISSIKERRKGLIAEAKARIAKASKVVAKIEKKEPHSSKLHHKKRMLAILKSRLAAMQKDIETNRIRLCFGSRKMFRAQFSLDANGYESLADWKKDWQAGRASEFVVLGSKDETAGCQGCVISANEDGSFNLRLRLPNGLVEHGKYLGLDELRFAYGAEEIRSVMLSGSAITYRFKQRDGHWYVFLSITVDAAPVISHRELGAVGVDINADHLAVSEIDRYGNLVRSEHIQCVTYGKSYEQSKAIIGNAVKYLSDWAVSVSKPIVIEKLEFSKKKAAMESAFNSDDKVRYARMLSAFAYNKIKMVITSAISRKGVEVLEVNPAYTSVIGAVNHAQRYGISIHMGAATAIARRGLGLSELPAVRIPVIPMRNGDHVTFPLPARNREKHVWSFWSKVRTGLKAVHVAHYRSGKLKDKPAPLSPEMRTLGANRSLQARPLHANRYQHCSGSVLDDIPL